MDEMPAVSSVNPQIEERQSSFLERYKFTLLALCVILIALVPLVIISRNHKTPTPTTQPTVGPTATPTPIPLTQSNAQPTLSATSQNVQAALDQSNQDLNQVNSIDTTQDSVAGL